jgi:uncharacterized membrane protein YidH (DUF202 family)
MDFIERMFGVSPDGGNGSLELLLLLSIAAAIAILCYGVYRRRANRRIRSRIEDRPELAEAVNTVRL